MLTYSHWSHLNTFSTVSLLIIAHVDLWILSSASEAFVAVFEIASGRWRSWRRSWEGDWCLVGEGFSASPPIGPGLKPRSGPRCCSSFMVTSSLWASRWRLPQPPLPQILQKDLEAGQASASFVRQKCMATCGFLCSDCLLWPEVHQVNFTHAWCSWVEGEIFLK